VGRSREDNEDNLLVDTELGLFIVADGMGGHEAGELASSIAVVEIATHVREQIRLGKEVGAVLVEAIQRANADIIRSSPKDVDYGEMGSTVVLALFMNNQLHMAHVGDSRAYRMRNGTMKQLTHDHTFLADWVKEGRITAKEARTHPDRHGIYAALGIDEDVEVEISRHSWDDESCLLLCSDGLTDMVDDEEIATVLRLIDDPQEACDMLVDRANKKGGEDNITVILVC
jgi:serine/threonine protein phosphatase PrpC